MTKSTKVYANRATKKFHSQRRGDRCRQGEILIRNQRVYDNPEAAVAVGYMPCLSCFQVAGIAVPEK